MPIPKILHKAHNNSDEYVMSYSKKEVQDILVTLSEKADLYFAEQQLVRF